DEVVKGNASIWLDEYRFRLEDGSYASISDHGYIERDTSGKALRLIGAMSDVTERKQAEEKIQHQLQRLNGLRSIDIAISSSFDIRVTLDVVLQQVISQL